MKLIIQIPCLNEEKNLPATIADLPKHIPDIDDIEYLVISDGSTDRTVEVARELGVHHIVELRTNHGLGKAFSIGIEKALALGADIVVNTDGDNQYNGADIGKLIEPILRNEADFVVGSRPIANHPEFGFFKKKLQQLGSWTLRYISGTHIRDAASGFRAYSRNTCLRLFVYSTFSHCMETLIGAGAIGLRVESVDISVNPKTRQSRLFRNIYQYIARSAWTILTMFVFHSPGHFFLIWASLFYAGALVLGLRFIYLVYIVPVPEPGRTYLPSLILLCILGVIGTLFLFFAIFGELLRSQRRISEENLYLIRRLRLDMKKNMATTSGVRDNGLG